MFWKECRVKFITLLFSPQWLDIDTPQPLLHRCTGVKSAMRSQSLNALHQRIFTLSPKALLKGLACLLIAAGAQFSRASYNIQYSGVITTLGTGTLGTNPSGIALDLSG